MVSISTSVSLRLRSGLTVLSVHEARNDFRDAHLQKQGWVTKQILLLVSELVVNLDYLIGLSVEARSRGVIQRFAFERRDMGCRVSAFLVRAITDINKPVRSV